MKETGDYQDQGKGDRDGRPHGEHMWCWVMKSGEQTGNGEAGYGTGRATGSLDLEM